MKTYLLAIVFALSSITVYSQQHKRTNYLTIWFEKKFNYGIDHYYHLMFAELGNADVPEVSNLVIYKPGRNLKTEEVFFYSEENDSAKVYYNYFFNPTAALEYLGRYGWQLISVVNQINSDYKYVDAYGIQALIPTISFKPIYYLKREIE